MKERTAGGARLDFLLFFLSRAFYVGEGGDEERQEEDGMRTSVTLTAFFSSSLPSSKSFRCGGGSRTIASSNISLSPLSLNDGGGLLIKRGGIEEDPFLCSGPGQKPGLAHFSLPLPTNHLMVAWKK